MTSYCISCVIETILKHVVRTVSKDKVRVRIRIKISHVINAIMVSSK